MTNTFHGAIRAAGLTPPDHIEPGRLHRFPGAGKSNGNTSGWCKLFLDGQGGVYGDWSIDLHGTWQAKQERPFTQEERAAFAKQVREAKAAMIKEQEQRHQVAAAKIPAIMTAATGDPAGHPYADMKGLPLGDLIKRGAWPDPRGRKGEIWPDALLIPLYGKGGKISTISAINSDGEKDLLAGGRKKGSFYPMGRITGATGRVLVAEGLATLAAAVHSTGLPGVMAVDAGNLEPTARIVRELAPAAEIIIIADDDRKEDGSNPGKTAAIKAALAVGAKVAIPDLDRKADAWNLWKEQGPDAVKRMIEAAAPPAGSVATSCTPVNNYSPRVELLRGSDIVPEPVNWLWDGWMARGKMHVFGGAPGTGKTTIAMSLAAIVTTGGRWPDGSQSPVGNVVVWSGEDDPKDTLVPRLSLSGADLNRVYFISDVCQGTERRSFDPAKDMEPLSRKLAEIGGVSLLIVDPLVSAVTGDSHKNAEVRRSLQPLADLAATMRCALLGITHFSKGTGGRDPVERLTGSLAFGALARIVLVAAKHQEEGEDGRTVRVFLRAKSNIGPDTGGFEYDFHQGELTDYPGVFASSVLWGEAVEGAARELLATADSAGDDGEGGTLADAKRFLSELLTVGGMPVKTIRGDADGAGYSWATIRRAQKALKIEPKKVGGTFGGGKQQWVWVLPGTEGAQGAQAEHLQDETLKVLNNTEDAQQKKVSTFKNIEHLQAADTHDSAIVEVEI